MTHYGPVRWTRDDEDAFQAEQAHTEHTDGRAPDPADCAACESEYRRTHPANKGACLCDVADAPAHEDYRETDCPECRHDHTNDGRDSYIGGAEYLTSLPGHSDICDCQKGEAK